MGRTLNLSLSQQEIYKMSRIVACSRRTVQVTFMLVACCLSAQDDLVQAQTAPGAQANLPVEELSVPLPLWSELAPGETTREFGINLPARATDVPTITRVEKITQPTLDVLLADKPTGTAVLILPGGGFRYVVPDLEGSEAAKWLNKLGISACVLRYRTTDAADGARWQRPLQDSQRAMRLMRSKASQWNIDPAKIGILGFSAGGQVAAIHLASKQASYPATDAIDQLSFRPDFSLLIYPWRIYDEVSLGLIEPIHLTADVPPAFIVHTHDDASTALGAVYYYAGLKRLGVPAELHVYQNGGHGYGIRARPQSMIGTWTERATEWLRLNHW
jgi:acetyl esterase/lipase